MEKKEMIWDNGILRECTQSEIDEFSKEGNVDILYVETLSYDELVNVKIREKYTESQEFAILRQKDEKPEEYAEYYGYCEECKEYVRNHIKQFTEAEELL